MGGRQAVLDAVEQLGLVVPTTDLPHHIDGLLSIDHVAVPASWSAAAARISADNGDRRLSDHDAYVVEVV